MGGGARRLLLQERQAGIRAGIESAGNASCSSCWQSDPAVSSTHHCSASALLSGMALSTPPPPWRRHLLLNLRLWSAAALGMQSQLLGLWGRLTQARPKRRAILYDQASGLGEVYLPGQGCCPGVVCASIQRSQPAPPTSLCSPPCCPCSIWFCRASRCLCAACCPLPRCCITCAAATSVAGQTGEPGSMHSRRSRRMHQQGWRKGGRQEPCLQS